MRSKRPTRAVPAPTDERWLAAGRLRHHATAPPAPRSAEHLASWYWACVRDGDTAAALYFSIHAIELLHAEYVTEAMTARRPGLDDQPILRNCEQAVAEVLRVRPDAPLQRELDHVMSMLQEIVAASRRFHITEVALATYHAALRSFEALGT